MKITQEHMDKFNEFIEQNILKYPAPVIRFIMDNFDKKIKTIEGIDIVNQVYDELGFLSDENNIYISFLNIVSRYHSLDGNILQVGGGYIPALSKHIATQQLKIGRGTITVYDSKLIIKNYKGIILIKRNLTKKDDLSPYDSIVGLFMRDDAETIIEQAFKYNKDYSIGLCGCVPKNPHLQKHILSTQEWYEYIISKAERMKRKKDELYIDCLNSQYGETSIITKVKRHL